MSEHSEDNLIQYLKGKNEEHSGFLGQEKASIFRHLQVIKYPAVYWNGWLGIADLGYAGMIFYFLDLPQQHFWN